MLRRCPSSRPRWMSSRVHAAPGCRRRAVLREVSRILRPAGTFGLVTWLADDAVMAPDAEFDEAVHDLGLEVPKPRRVPVLSEIERWELRDDLVAAGFEDVDVQPDRLEHAWTREAYLDSRRAMTSGTSSTRCRPATGASACARGALAFLPTRPSDCGRHW
jgi:hypothetical protein